MVPHRSPPDSGREPLHYFRFLGYLAGHLYFPINYNSRSHENTVLGELFHVLNIQHFRVHTLLLYYVLNQVVELVAFGSACT
jgi:hypothetical protein